VFYISAGIYLVGGIAYAIFASGNRRKWAQIAEADDSNLPTTNISLSVADGVLDSSQK